MKPDEGDGFIFNFITLMNIMKCLELYFIAFFFNEFLVQHSIADSLIF